MEATLTTLGVSRNYDEYLLPTRVEDLSWNQAHSIVSSMLGPCV